MDRTEYFKEYKKRMRKRQELLARIRRKAKREDLPFSIRLRQVTDDVVDIICCDNGKGYVYGNCILIKGRQYE